MKGIFFSAILTGLLLGMLEGFLRLNAGPVETPAYYFLPGQGLRLKANERRHFQHAPQNGGHRVEWSTNSEGFRGPELLKETKARIVVYGDSSIQAQFSEYSNTYSARLQKALSFDSEVINAGTLGMGPDQNLIRMKEELPRLHPKLIIFQVYGDNDFGDLIRNRFFLLDQNELKRTRFEPTNDLSLEAFERDQNLPLLWRRLRSKFSEPRASLGPDEEIQMELDRLKRESLDYPNFNAPFAQFHDCYDFDLALTPGLATSETKMKLMEAVLKEAHRSAKNAGSDFLLLIVPSVVDLTSNYRIHSGMLRKLSEAYEPRNLTGIFEKIAERNEIPYLNLFEEFAANSPEKLYFLDPDIHWNDEGQSLAAKLTASLIEQGPQMGSDHWLQALRASRD